MSNNKVEVSAPVTLAAAGNSTSVPIPFINSAGGATPIVGSGASSS